MENQKANLTLDGEILAIANTRSLPSSCIPHHIATPQVLKPAIILAGVTALSHAFENKLLKLNLVITLPGLLCRNWWQTVLHCIFNGENTPQSNG